ncbi:Serine phosphatase RsbU, regulator of sigma subunit [Streptomyces sp. Ag82_O1-12]|uniref:SpoIIE family protein phosphatase n=1 Tax=Streptomyces sp. Ag82_O1-12 TaxID=1938854 RepID=UPI000BC4F42C|nr:MULTISPECIES: SpoIIE family protein phosphatase [unclassified Streptomyces]SMQ19591.1 Serine phosphatase RsbU, regulator of sigma subunit [Streptomyces sp. Ag82_O1-12]SOD48632.1 Serine phosphatase RsbU, regulator of sigma subunit [Streptomyces sp. Ag82_G6-1]
MPHHGDARAAVPGLRAPGNGGTDPPRPAPETAARARLLAFAGVTLAAVYVRSDDGAELCLVESAGAESEQRYQLPGRVAVSDSAGAPGAGPSASPGAESPAAPHGAPTSVPSGPTGSQGGCPAVVEAFLRGRAVWLAGVVLPGREEAATAAVPLGALPLGAAGGWLGCLVVVGEAGEGFGAEQREFLERYAEAVAERLRGEADRSAPAPLLDSALRAMGVGSFALSPGTGLVETDPALLELVGIPEGGFDGKTDTLLSCSVPEDVPALMSVIEPSAQTPGRREMEFRIRRPTGELCWLRLNCRVLKSPDGAPERVLGVVSAAPVLRRSASDVARIQWLTAALDDATTVRDVSRVVVAALREPLSADRVALAELLEDRLAVTVLDPPSAGAWPELWRREWRSEWPDAPVTALPTLQAALRDGRMSLWPAGSVLEPGLAGIGPGGLAVLPLPAKSGVAGVCLVGWDTPHEFAPEERALLTATAGLVGQALKRAHAYDAEQELATMLQRSLLPRRLPRLPGGTAVARYLPARRGLQVGGDWYDVIALSESKVALVIGDVQGHSAGAATIMGQMRTAVRAYAVEGHPPDVVVAHANRLLVGMETDLFATCCYVELDMEEGNALFVRAGHLAPLVRHPDGSTAEIAVEGGLPLGVLADAEFPLTALALAPGSVLALVTDGLVESADLQVDEGMRLVRLALAAADPADPGRMADALLGEDGRREDDVAILLLRYDGMRVRPVRAGWVVWRLPDAVMHARRFSARTLRSWGIAAEADTVLLVVSELVTNALVHTQGAVRVELTLAADRLRVTVNDSSPRAPAKPVVVDWESTGGRGLFLVEAVSAAWGSVPVGGGKQVWSEIVVTRSERETEDGEEPDDEPEAEPEEERKPGRGWGLGRDRSWGLGRNRDRRRAREQGRHRDDDRATDRDDDHATDPDGGSAADLDPDGGSAADLDPDHATDRDPDPERAPSRSREREAGRRGEQAVGLDRAMEHIGNNVADPPPSSPRDRTHEGGT